MVSDYYFFRSEKSLFTSKRLLNIIEYLTFEMYRYTCRGLYEEHKFLLTLFLTLKKDLQTGHVRHQEFQVLIKGTELPFLSFISLFITDKIKYLSYFTIIWSYLLPWPKVPNVCHEK